MDMPQKPTRNKKRITQGLMVLMLLAVIATYLGLFLQKGMDFYGHFLRVAPTESGTTVTRYEGQGEKGPVTVAVTLLNQQDTLVEFTSRGETMEYVQETGGEGKEVRLYDGSNALVFSGVLDLEKRILTPISGEPILIDRYHPQVTEEHSDVHPDPVLVVLTAEGLNGRIRGDWSYFILATVLLGLYGAIRGIPRLHLNIGYAGKPQDHPHPVMRGFLLLAPWVILYLYFRAL